MGFFGKFFVAIFAVCAAGGAWAGCLCGSMNCADNEYCNVTSTPIGGGTMTVYECTPCPSGAGPTNNCKTCEYCAGYNIRPCPGYENNSSVYCKEIVSTNCDGVPGCKKYEACQKTGQYAGSTWYVAGPSNVCHIEGEECYPNTRACMDFGVGYDYDCLNVQASHNNDDGLLVCEKAQQQGNAQWNGNEWNVSGCRCPNETRVFGLKCVAHYVLKPALNYPVDGEVVYGDCPSTNIESYYCTQCNPGTCPGRFQQNNAAGGADSCGAGRTDGEYSVCNCVDVAANYYSVGFQIPDFLNTNTLSGCRIPCEHGFTTNGQTGATACVPDGMTAYDDSTGWFTLGSNQCNP